MTLSFEQNILMEITKFTLTFVSVFFYSVETACAHGGQIAKIK